MEKICSLVRRCVEDYDMIQPGDRVAVGVSGGKDSLVTLTALAKLSRYYPKPFTVEAFTLDMGAADGRQRADFGPVADYCAGLEVPFHLISSEISHIIFDLRKEKNPCSMCAKMRRELFTMPFWRPGSPRSPWDIILTTRWRPFSCPCFTRDG